MSSSSFGVAVKSSDGAEITKEVNFEDKKFIFFTRLSQGEDKWVIGLTDGLTAWTVEHTKDSVKEWDGGRGVDAIKDVCRYLQNDSSQLQRSHDSSNLSMTVRMAGTGKEVQWALQQVSDTQFKAEMKYLLFFLSGSLRDTSAKLESCQRDLNIARSAAAAAGGLGDISVSSASSGKTAASKQKRVKGASIVNPSSKRRKAATGVVFDADS